MMKKNFYISIILIFMVMLSGCDKNTGNTSNNQQVEIIEKPIMIKGKFIIEQKTNSWGMVNGILISGYECDQMTKKGCPYVNKNVKITGYLGKEACIGGLQCMRTQEMDVESITITDK